MTAIIRSPVDCSRRRLHTQSYTMASPPPDPPVRLYRYIIKQPSQTPRALPLLLTQRNNPNDANSARRAAFPTVEIRISENSYDLSGFVEADLGLRKKFKKLVVEFTDKPIDGNTDISGMKRYVCSLGFQHALEACFLRLPHLSDFTLRSPRVSPVARPWVHCEMSDLWKWTIFRALKAMSMVKGLHLKDVAIGGEDELSLPTPHTLFTRWAPLGWTVDRLRCLELRLFGIEVDGRGAAANDFTIVPDSPSTLISFSYQGKDTESAFYVESPKLFEPGQVPLLTVLNLATMTTTASRFDNLFQTLSGTLKDLVLHEVNLCGGTWNHVFGDIVRHLRLLETARFSKLTRGDCRIRFTRIKQSRLISIDYVDFWVDRDLDTILDGENHLEFPEEYEETLEPGETRKHGEKRKRVEEIDLESFIEEIEPPSDFVWVVCEGTGRWGDGSNIKFNVSEDGDLKPLLELVRDNHQVI